MIISRKNYGHYLVRKDFSAKRFMTPVFTYNIIPPELASSTHKIHCSCFITQTLFYTKSAIERTCMMFNVISCMWYGNFLSPRSNFFGWKWGKSCECCHIGPLKSCEKYASRPNILSYVISFSHIKYYCYIILAYQVLLLLFIIIIYWFIKRYHTYVSQRCTM